MIPLTPKQAKVYRWLKQYFRRGRDTSPSYAEIAAGCKLKSDGHASQYVRQLERRGYITRTAGVRRSIQLVEKNDRGESHGNEKAGTPRSD